MTELAHPGIGKRGRPRARPRTVAALQQEIAEKRGDLREDLDLLRDAVSVQLDPIAQLRAHPRALAVVAGVAAVAVGWMAVAFVRAMRANR
jgi:hypothetical protein